MFFAPGVWETAHLGLRLRRVIPFAHQKNWSTMKQITAATIDAAIEELENLSDDLYEQRMEAFAEAQPVLFSYLFSGQFDLLTDDEKGYLQYLALIAWRSIERGGGPVDPVSEEQIGEAEEKNYELLEKSSASKFQDRLDAFFDDYEQEDLLAFAEEAVMEEEEQGESLVTKEGREPIFIALKTMIDVLTANERE
jgi:hypothetical protein